MPDMTHAAPVRHHLVLITAALMLVAPRALAAQSAPLTVGEARRQARQASPAIAAARAALDAAAALERQAGAWSNPTLSYSREQTSGNAQDIAAVEQRVEIGGQRSARVAAARLRRDAAEARLAAVESALDVEVARGFADVMAADRRAELAGSTAAEFRTAAAAMSARLAEGDVSAYEARRIHLESARYQALAAEALLIRNEARLRLQSLLGGTGDDAFAPLEVDPTADATLSLGRDSLVAVALQRNAELQAATLDARAAYADASLATRERTPTPAVSGGFKRESAADDGGGSGFVLGLSIPVPVWDRRAGAIGAAQAEARRLAAERDAVARRIARETASALESVQQMDAQVVALRSVLGDEARAALRAAETAYAEGEITLVEWLDAVRAYQEAELAFAAVLSQAFTQRAVLERLLGAALIR